MKGNFTLFVAVMSATMCDKKFPILNVIDQPVFVIDPAAELPLEIPGEGFRLSYASHTAVSLYVFYELVDALQRFFVLALPIKIVLPGVVRPNFVHASSTSISSWAAPFPARSSETDFFT